MKWHGRPAHVSCVQIEKGNRDIQNYLHSTQLTRKIHDSPQRHREHREISRIDERQVRTLHLFRQTKKRVNFIFFLVFSVISVSLW